MGPCVSTTNSGGKSPNGKSASNTADNTPKSVNEDVIYLTYFIVLKEIYINEET